MASPVVGDLIKTTWSAYLSPQLGLTTLAFRVAAVAGGGATLQEIADFIRTSSTAEWQAINTTSVTLNGVLAYTYAPALKNAKDRAFSADNVTTGLVPGDLCPKQAAAMVRKSTIIPGRAFRGRCYLPFVPQSFVNAQGELTAAGLVLYNLFRVSWITTYVVVGAGGTTTLIPVLMHPYSGGWSSNDISSSSMSGLIGTQHRRGDFGKTNNPIS